MANKEITLIIPEANEPRLMAIFGTLAELKKFLVLAVKSRVQQVEKAEAENTVNVPDDILS